MQMIELEITFNDPEFFKALEDPNGFLPFQVTAMENIMTAYQKVAEVYAAESEANRPGRRDSKGRPMGYYERGRGWWKPITTHIRPALMSELPTLGLHPKAPHTMGADVLGAVGIEGVTGYELMGGSEQMHDRWSWNISTAEGEVVGNLVNTASYSGSVQGLEQIPLHKERGWRTVMSSWDEADVQRTVDAETIRALNAYYNLGAS